MRRKLAYLGAILAPLALVLGLMTGNASAFSYAHVVMAGGGSWCLTTDIDTQSGGPDYVNPGDPVFLYACTTDQGNQHWAEVTYDNANTWFLSELPDLNGDQMCLADTGNNQTDGTPWEIWYCSANAGYEKLYNWVFGSGYNQWCLDGAVPPYGPCISDDGGNRWNYNTIIVYHRETSFPYWQTWYGPGPN